jgi:hypothetical protein
MPESPTFDVACARLRDLMEQSLGLLIPLSSGNQRAFRLTAEYTAEDVAEFEEHWEVEFPAVYRRFLIEVGAGELCYGGGVKGRSVHRLEDIPELYAEYIDTDTEPVFARLQPIGCDYGRREVAAFCLDRPGPLNFALFPSDVDPLEWIPQADAQGTWGRFEDWIIEAADDRV